MDPPVLRPLALELARSERLAALLAEGRSARVRARVSEPILPLFLAAAWLAGRDQLTSHDQPDVEDGVGPGLVCVLPEDADARDAAEAAAWFIGADGVGLLPSRGVSFESGLEPPAHLVGERARALEVYAGGGLVCASALGYAQGLPSDGSRPAAIRLVVGDEPGGAELAEELALAGYERVERVEERGQIAVRGGIVDVFCSTGRDPLRIELFGDEIESIRAFSPFTQRTLYPVDAAIVFPAAERRQDLASPSEDDEAGSRTAALVPPLPRADFVWEAQDVASIWDEELGGQIELSDAVRLDPVPAGQPHVIEAARPAVAARGLAEAERELDALVRAGSRVIVGFAHRGEVL
jgi:transcription-repair coupling factor (superfamily II helicase)